jgi:hypothetical protein
VARKLKVFRTPIGFHDAYVAAPSRKAALAAWGADGDLFARGAAEEVTDPALSKEPLASPGTVIRRTRGSMAEHMATLDATPAPRRRAARKQDDAPRPPRPDRDALDRAEEDLARAGDQHEAALARIAKRQAALDRERRALERDHDAEIERLEDAKAKAAAAYRRAMTAWQKG